MKVPVSTKCSTFGLFVFAAFLVLVFSFRFTLPFGDEPDFSIRAAEIVDGNVSRWTPYYWLSNIYRSIDIESNCVILASPYALTAKIDAISCGEDLGQVIFRGLATILITFPIWLLLLWRSIASFMIHKITNVQLNQINRRIDATGLALLLPGMVYYLGLLSHEQFTLSLSIFIFIFWGNWIVVIFLTGLIGAIDIGNSVLIVAFILIYISFSFAASKFGIRVTVFLAVLICYISYIKNFSILNYFISFPLFESKISSINIALQDGYYHEKYLLYLRPIITFMSAIFLTPSGIKFGHLYILAGIATLYIMHKFFRDVGVEEKSVRLVILSIVTMIFCVSCILPTHVNAKYFIWLTPFILEAALLVINRWKIFFALFCSSLTIPIGMLVYRL